MHDDVTPRTAESSLEKAGRCTEESHRLQLERREQPLEIVELGEPHTRSPPAKNKMLLVLPGRTKAEADELVGPHESLARRPLLRPSLVVVA